MDRHQGSQSALTVALHRGLYLAIIVHLYEGPQTARNIAWHRGLYVAIIMDMYEGPKLPLL
jgi:hypothetical protein